MSAFICSDRHVATIAVRYAELVGAPETAQEIADELLAITVTTKTPRSSPAAWTTSPRSLASRISSSSVAASITSPANCRTTATRCSSGSGRSSRPRGALEGDVVESPIWSI